MAKTRDRRCGTYAGWQAHTRAGEPACDDCQKARTEYMRQYRATRDGARRINRLRIAARSRALSRLAAQHPDDYRRLYIDEVARDPAIGELKSRMEATRPNRKGSS